MRAPCTQSGRVSRSFWLEPAHRNKLTPCTKLLAEHTGESFGNVVCVSHCVCGAHVVRRFTCCSPGDTMHIREQSACRRPIHILSESVNLNLFVKIAILTRASPLVFIDYTPPTSAFHTYISWPADTKEQNSGCRDAGRRAPGHLPRGCLGAHWLVPELVRPPTRLPPALWPRHSGQHSCWLRSVLLSALSLTPWLWPCILFQPV